MREFSCIGSACEDSCCAGWRVNIDEETYKKYKKTKDKEIKPIISKNIIRNRSNPTSNNFAKIKMNDGGRCSFLTENSLCKIQINLGEEYLSNTCSVYPRIINNVNGVVEKSLTMSCPEAARLALLNPNGIQFDEIEESISGRDFVVKQLVSNTPAQFNKPLKYFWELRIFTIQVLQNRAYTLNERLILLGIFYRKIQEIVDTNKLDSIPQEIAHYVQMIANDGVKGALSNVPSQFGIQMELCKELLDYRVAHGMVSERYMKCLFETLQGIGYTSEKKLKKLQRTTRSQLKYIIILL